MPQIHTNKQKHNAMTLAAYTLIAIPVCIAAILIWTYFDYRKYKRKHHLLVLLPFLFPTLSQAQYIDKDCRISFKSHENRQGKLECIENDVCYQFIPNCNAWKVTIRNNTDEVVWLNWEKASFIINGKASSLSRYPATTGETAMESIESNRETSRTITASGLIAGNGIDNIYHKKHIRKGRKTSIAIVLPVRIGTQPQFFHTFNFIVTKAD